MAYTDSLSSDMEKIEEATYQRLKNDKRTLEAMEQFIRTGICNIEDDDE